APIGSAPTPSGSVVTGAENGVAGLSAEKIAETAVRSLTHNYPMRMKGTMVDDNGRPVVTFDIVRENLEDAQGTVLVKGKTLEIIRVGGHDYAKADADVWIAHGSSVLSSPAAAARVSGKWVRAEMYSGELPVDRFVSIHDDLWEALANDTG